MGRMRFSIAGLMGFVLVAALGFGGLKGANENWASGCYTLIVAALILAVLTALQSRGRNRAYWAGFAIAGWVYFGVVFGTFGPFRVTPPRLLTEVLFDRLEAMMHPNNAITLGYFTVTTTASPPATPLSSPPGPVAIAGTLTGSITGSANNTPPPPLVIPLPTPPVPVAAPPISPTFAFATPPTPWIMPPSNMSRVYFSQIAHSLMVLVVGMLGGYYSTWLFARRERREAIAVVEVSPSSP